MTKRKLVSITDNTDNISLNKKRKTIHPGKDITEKLQKTQKRSKDDDKNKKLWKGFNTYQKHNKSKEEIARKEWVAPSSIRFSMMDDRCAEWLKSKNRGNGSYKLNPRNLPDHIRKGNEFEEDVLNDIKERFPRNYEAVSDNSHPSLALMEKTFKLMKKGVPFISQAILYNFTNKTFGAADLLVRSDWLNKLFEDEIMYKNDEKIPSPILETDYHYVVIDIKYSTLNLCSDGRRIRNANNISYYKGQLTIYNAALGLLQGYTPNYAYVLGKAWKYTSKGEKFSGYDCFDRVGCIHFANFDKKYIEKTADCVNWVRNLRYNGSNWSTSPPSNEHLYPNMKNSYDAPFHGAKKRIAEEIGELTTLWYVGLKNRRIAHSGGITNRNDENLTADILGIKGSRGEILDEILNTNNNPDSGYVNPKKIESTQFGWNERHELDFYVDIETLNTHNMIPIDIGDSQAESGIIFCIGVGYEVDGKWVHKKFYTDNYEPMRTDSEYKVIDDFFNFISERVDKYKRKTGKKKSVARFYHWFHAEPVCFKKANTRLEGAWTDMIYDSEWIDLYKIFTNEPITVRGAYNFNLKSVAKAFHKHGLIDTVWNDSIVDGYQVVVEACAYYDFMNKYDQMTSTDKNKYRKMYRIKQNIFDEIIKYNEVDCKVMWEIVKYLRENHL